MGTRVLLKPSEKDFTAHIIEASTIMAAFPNDVVIVSAENEEIKANRIILSVHSPTMACLLSSSSTIILPDCSSKSLKILISIITKGFTTNECSTFDINDILEVVDTGRILGIKVKNLKPNFFCGISDGKSKDKKVKSPEDVNDQAKVIDHNITDKSDLSDKVNVANKKAKPIQNDKTKEKSEDFESKLLHKKPTEIIKDVIEKSPSNNCDIDVSEHVDQDLDNLEDDFWIDADNSIAGESKIKNDGNVEMNSEGTDPSNVKDIDNRKIDFQKQIDEIRNNLNNLTEETDKAIAAEDISDSVPKILVNKTDIKHGKSGKKNYHTNTTFVDDKIEEDGNKYVGTDTTNLKSNNDNTKKIIVDCQICNKHFNPKTGSANISLQYHYAIHHFKQDLSADLLNGEKCILCDKTFSRWDNALVHIGGFHNKLDKLLSNKGLQKLRKSKLPAKEKLSTNDKSENLSEGEGDKHAGEDNGNIAGEDSGNIDSQEVFKCHTNGTKISKDPYNVDKNLNNTSKKGVQESLNVDLNDLKVTNDENMDQKESINNGVECQICNKYFRRLSNLEYHYSMFHFKEDLLMLKDFLDEKKCIPCDKVFARKYVAIMHVGVYHKKIDLFLFNKGLKISTKKSNKKDEDRHKIKDISNTKKKGIFSKQQIALLTAEFEKCEILTNSICNSLAKRTGLKTKQIRNLFKIKKDMRRQNPNDISDTKSACLMKKKGKFSRQQISLLMAEFQKREILNKSSCTSLANITGLKTKQIRLWFKCQRRKRKQKLAATSKSIESIKSFEENKTTFIESNYTEQPKSMLKPDKLDISVRKNRRYFSNEQIALLTAEFEKSETLNESTCALLATSTGLRIRQIKMWFLKRKWMLNKKSN